MVCVRTTTWRQHSRSCTGCRSSNGSTINCASCCTKWLFVKRHPTWLACWLQCLRSHTVDSLRRVKRKLRHSQDPSEIRREDVFCCCPPSMEPPANRTQADAFHAGFQAFLENVLVPDCLLDCTIKLDSVMRHRSSCRMCTKSTFIMIMINNKRNKQTYIIITDSGFLFTFVWPCDQYIKML